MTHPDWKPYAEWRESYLKGGGDELIYLAAPYSKAQDKDALMHKIMRYCGEHALANPGKHIVSPLFNHYALHLVPGLAGDYEFWGRYSRNLLARCDRMIVLTLDGWRESVGVQDEIKLATELGMTILYAYI